VMGTIKGSCKGCPRRNQPRSGLIKPHQRRGVDAVLVSSPPRSPPPLAPAQEPVPPYPEALRQQRYLHRPGQAAPAATVLNLLKAVTEVQYCARLCDPRLASLVGCHVRPSASPHLMLAGGGGKLAGLLQAPLLAELLQRPVVFDNAQPRTFASGAWGHRSCRPADAPYCQAIGAAALLNLGASPT